MGLAAGLLAQASHRRPEDPGLADGFQVQLGGLDLQVRRRGETPIEVERKIIRRHDGAERHGCGPLLDGGDKAVIHVELAQFTVEVFPEGVVAGARDHACIAAMPRGGHGHIGRGTTEVLSEGRHVLQIHPDVVRVDINADAPDREQFVGHGNRGPFWFELHTSEQLELRFLAGPRERGHIHYFALESLSCQRFVLTYLQHGIMRHIGACGTSLRDGPAATTFGEPPVLP